MSAISLNARIYNPCYNLLVNYFGGCLNKWNYLIQPFKCLKLRLYQFRVVQESRPFDVEKPIMVGFKVSIKNWTNHLTSSIFTKETFFNN